VLLQLNSLGKQIGGRWLFQDTSMTINAGDRVGVVGPNGAGKSTLLRVVSGEEAGDAGEVSLPRGTRIGMLRQEIDPRQTRTVEEEASTALARLDELERELRELEQSMIELGERGDAIPDMLAERYDYVSHQFQHGGGFEREAQVARVLAGLGFDDEARGRPLHTFSGGWLMRVELAKLFLSEPDILLLDEPTNHLDLPAIQWFEETIAAFPGALLVVSHDRTFLTKHVTRVIELDGLGRANTYEAPYERYLTLREERREQLLARKANQDREIAQMERFVERFRAKSTKAKQAQSRIKALGRIERIEVDAENKRAMRMKIPPPPRSGQQVIKLEHIVKSYAEKRVYEDLNFGLLRGERVALAGPNGAGKSTLLRIVAGALEFDSGERTLGHNVQSAYFAQHQLEALDSKLTVLQELEKDALSDDVPRLRGHLGAFLFSGDDVDKKISVLSGGEKSRVALAKLLLRPANLLILDEPTNHLDIVSCEVLERALQTYEGTLIFVSHDRAFINALATKVVEVRYGVLREFIGDYDDYLHRLKQLESTIAKPTANDSAVSDTVAPEAKLATQVESAAKSGSKSGSRSKSDSKPASKSASKSRTASKSESGPKADSEPKPKPKPASKAERQAERERRKTHDKLTRKVEKLEQQISEQEQALEELGFRLGDPSVYNDRERLQEVQEQQAALKTIIADLYDGWERLNDEATALDDVL
jgi:ATP-binding cassette subfamily F protein 3